MGRAANRNDVIFGVAWRGVAWRGKKLFIDRTNTNSTVPLASNDARTYSYTDRDARDAARTSVYAHINYALIHPNSSPRSNHKIRYAHGRAIGESFKEAGGASTR